MLISKQDLPLLFNVFLSQFAEPLDEYYKSDDFYYSLFLVYGEDILDYPEVFRSAAMIFHISRITQEPVIK